MKPPKPLPRLSAKKKAALKGKPVYSTIRKRPRKKSETLRIYGPPARRAFVAGLPCSACGVVGFSENAHLLGNGGMSRKADADTIGPLCCERPATCEATVGMGVRFIGCHEQYDRYRWAFEKSNPDFDPAKVAADTQKLWEAANVR